MSNPEDELGGPVLRLLKSVESVTIVKGHVPSDPTFWHIKIGGEVLEIEAIKLDTPSAFRRQYLKFFDKPAPSMQKEWYPFIEILGERAEKVIAKEESERVYYAEQLMEHIRELPRVDSPEDYNRGLLKHEGFYLLHSGKIGDIIDSLHYSVSPQVLSKTLADLGYKREGNARLRVDGVQKRFWWFKPQAIDPEPLKDSQMYEIEGEVLA